LRGGLIQFYRLLGGHRKDTGKTLKKVREGGTQIDESENS